MSLGIVLTVCLFSYGIYDDSRTVPELYAGPTGRTVGFIAAAAICLVATALRMTAGSALRSGRIMSFTVRPESLVVSPPYNLVRNPIYLADLLAAAGFSLCMPPPGLLFPLMLGLHYRRLVRFEEDHLSARHSGTFEGYLTSVPRLAPTFSSLGAFVRSIPSCRIDRDGARFNALYLLFVPGLCVSAVTGEFFHAVLLGLPAVADWAYWHTVKGLHPTTEEVPHET